MIPYLSPRESAPILAMTKPPAAKWMPTPGEEIEVATSLSGGRIRREFLRMDGAFYVVRAKSAILPEVPFRCAWPIKRMSGPDMTPPPEPYPGMVILSKPNDPTNWNADDDSGITPAAADPDGWIKWKEGDKVPSGMIEVKWVHWKLGEISEVLDARNVFWSDDGSVIAYKVLP